MLLVISILGFFATVALFLGLSLPLRRHGFNQEKQEKQYSVLSGGVVGTLIPLLARNNDKLFSEVYRASLEQKLLYAGKPGGEISGSEYIAAAELLGFAVWMVFMLLFGSLIGFTLVTIFTSVMTGVLVAWLMIAYLDNMVSERRLKISRQFPYFLDLAVMAMEAGSSLTETIEIFSRDNPGQALSEELNMVLKEIQMGKTLQEALQNFHQRISAEEVRNTIKAIQQGEKMGSSIGKVLRDQISMIRFERTQLAERMAEELKVRMLGPAMLMMVSVFILMLGPAIIEIANSGIF